MKRVAADTALAARQLGWTMTRLQGGPFKGTNIGPGKHVPIPEAPDWDAVVQGTAPLPWGWTHRVSVRPQYDADDKPTGKHIVVLDELSDSEIDERATGKPELTGKELADLKTAIKRPAAIGRRKV